MIEDLIKQDQDLLRAKINGETAKIPWTELQRFFAAGKVMWVASVLDLVEVAMALHEDDVSKVGQWTETSQLKPASDDQARDWFETDAMLWSVVVKPWVLVQEKSNLDNDERA
ncbi:MAG: DUF2288 domain-containing protein [Pseudomonadota bacterium]